MNEGRAQGAMLGMALGDAYGREFRRMDADRCRTASVSLDALQGTDDQTQVLFMAKAILDTSPGAFDERAFGHAIGRRFMEWSQTAEAPTAPPFAERRRTPGPETGAPAVASAEAPRRCARSRWPSPSRAIR